MSYENPRERPPGGQDDKTGQMPLVEPVPPGGGAEPVRPNRHRKMEIRPRRWSLQTLAVSALTIVAVIMAVGFGILVGSGKVIMPGTTPPPVSDASKYEAQPTDDFDPGADVEVDRPEPTVVEALDDGKHTISSGMTGLWVSEGARQGSTCRWKALDAHGSIVVSGTSLVGEPQHVTITGRARSFETSGCLPWNQTSPPAS